MDNLTLHIEHFSRLAVLLEETSVEEIKFSPIEVKVIFDLDNDPSELSEFYWNVKATFVKGNIN